MGSETLATCPLCSRPAAAPDGTYLAGYQLFVCPHCTLRFAPEAFLVPVDYDRVYQSDEYQRDQVRDLELQDGRAQTGHATYRAFFRQVRRFPGARLLDVGCGVGRFCHAAHSVGWDVTGIDVSARAIAIGRQFASFPLKVATLDALITQGDRFDVVTAFEVLEHLRDPLQFLSQANQVVQPGGQVFYTVPNWNSGLVQNSTRPDWLPPIHLQFFTEAALRSAGELGGLQRVRTGVITTDPVPPGTVARARWLARRLLQRPRDPLGLWMHGWLAAQVST